MIAECCLDGTCACIIRLDKRGENSVDSGFENFRFAEALENILRTLFESLAAFH